MAKAKHKIGLIHRTTKPASTPIGQAAAEGAAPLKAFNLPPTMEWTPAPPIWSMEVGKPATTTLYANHYYRLNSVVAAARSGDRILIELSLKNLDEKGSAL